MAGLWHLVVDHVYEIGLSELARVLAWHFLGVLEVVKKTLLLGIEVDVLTEKGIDLLPLVMLAIRVH